MHRRLRRIIGYTELYQLFKFLVRILTKQPFNSRPVLRDTYVVRFYQHIRVTAEFKLHPVLFKEIRRCYPSVLPVTVKERVAVRITASAIGNADIVEQHSIPYISLRRRKLNAFGNMLPQRAVIISFLISLRFQQFRLYCGKYLRKPSHHARNISCKKNPCKAS